MKMSDAVQHGRVAVQVADGAVFLAVTGELDPATAADLQYHLLNLHKVPLTSLTVDLTRCTHLGTAAILALHRLYSRSPHELHITVDRSDLTEILDAEGIPHHP